MNEVGEPVAIGVDIGGTKMLVASVDADGRIVERHRLESPRADADALVRGIVEVGRRLPGLPVGVGVAGIVSREGVLRYGPNLDVRDVPLRDRVAADLRVPVTVRNDATVALYAEMHAGAARGSEDVVMLTLGTGVGGAVASGGSLIEGAAGVGGELGHVPVADGGRLCPCGVRGCLEAYASGTAIGSYARRLLDETDDPSTLRDVDDIDGKEVTLAALDGDTLARRALDDAAYWLGVGLTGFVNVLDPEIVVVGGGAATLAAPIVLPIASSIMADRIIGAPERTPPAVVHAELSDDAGVIGAALLARDERQE